MPIKTTLEKFLSNANSKSNLPVPQLLEYSLANKEGLLTDRGALSVTTGKYTGRSPKDKFFVQDDNSLPEIDWGSVNQPLKPVYFHTLLQDVLNYLNDKDFLVFDGHAGANFKHRLSIRVVNELAWQNLFIHQLLLRPSKEELVEFAPDFHLICAPGFKANTARHGTNSEVVVALNLTEKLIIVAGSYYAGEIKKSVFTLVNYVLPRKKILSMHCSANVGNAGDVALFFGLSGTGKTTLSADPNRKLVGDDEHGWSEEGIFNIEGGCYAKCIGLSSADEPQIYNALQYGSVLENVIIDNDTRTPDFSSDELTENTRGAYPVNFIPNAVIPGVAPHPKVIFFLTADAFGVLPPIARLDKGLAMYHFLSGYTSKLAGTERGIVEPEATFSTCFGAPFLPLPPLVYARLLGEKISAHNTVVYLVNTGWTGGPYGVGQRFRIPHTRAIIKAALEGALNEASYRQDPIFGFEVPVSCPGVPAEIFDPRSTWPNPDQYDTQAKHLEQLFVNNFKKFKFSPDSL